MERRKYREIPGLTDEEVDRFWSRVEKTSDCWLWKPGARAGRYGLFWVKDAEYVVHRVSASIAGLLDDAEACFLTVDHLCRVTLCVRPTHFEIVTLRENIHRRPVVVECPQGHLYDDVNTYVSPVGKRTCRACNLASVHAYRQRRKAAA